MIFCGSYDFQYASIKSGILKLVAKVHKMSYPQFYLFLNKTNFSPFFLLAPDNTIINKTFEKNFDALIFELLIASNIKYSKVRKTTTLFHRF